MTKAKTNVEIFFIRILQSVIKVQYISAGNTQSLSLLPTRESQQSIRFSCQQHYIERNEFFLTRKFSSPSQCQFLRPIPPPRKQVLSLILFLTLRALFAELGQAFCRRSLGNGPQMSPHEFQCPTAANGGDPTHSTFQASFNLRLRHHGFTCVSVSYLYNFQ